MEDFAKVFRCKSARTFKEIGRELRQPLVIDKTGKLVRRKPPKKTVESQISKEVESNIEEEVQIQELEKWEIAFSIPDWASQILKDNGFATLYDVGRAWRLETDMLAVLLKSSGYDIDKTLCYRLRNAFSEAERKYLESNEELKFDLELSFFRAKFADTTSTATAALEPDSIKKVDAALLPSEDDNPLNDEYFIPPPLLLSKSAPVSNTFQHEAVNTPIKLFAPPTEAFSRQSSESEVTLELDQWIEKANPSDSSSILEELYDQGMLTLEAFQRLREHVFESNTMQNMKYESNSFSPPPFLRSTSTFVRSPSIKSTGSDRTRSLSHLSRPLPDGLKTHVFLAHTWMVDELGRNNHNRVSRINDELIQRGFITWFDATELSGDIRQKMADGLYNTCCVILFLTKGYEKKINSNDQKDNCFYEFNVIAGDNLVNRRIPVAMEKTMIDPRNWQRARLQAELGTQLIIDFSEDFEGNDHNFLLRFERKMDELVKRIDEEVEKVFMLKK